MKAFYINLDRRKDRNQSFIENYPLDIPIERFSAIDGRKDFGNVEYKFLKKHINDINRGEYGCFASHYILWKKLISSNIEHFIIFEDDAIFCNNFKNMFNKCISFLPNIKSILYIGGRFEPNFTTTRDIKINEYIGKHNYNIKWDNEHCDRTAHSYIIHRDFAKTLCENIENINWGGGVDVYINLILRKYQINFYNSIPLLCHSNEVAPDSDIRYETY